MPHATPWMPLYCADLVLAKKKTHGEAHELPQQLEAGVRCPSPAVVSEEQVDAVWRAGLACHRRPGSTHLNFILDI